MAIKRGFFFKYFPFEFYFKNNTKCCIVLHSLQYIGIAREEEKGKHSYQTNSANTNICCFLFPQLHRRQLYR